MFPGARRDDWPLPAQLRLPQRGWVASHQVAVLSVQSPVDAPQLFLKMADVSCSLTISQSIPPSHLMQLSMVDPQLQEVW